MSRQPVETEGSYEQSRHSKRCETMPLLPLDKTNRKISILDQFAVASSSIHMRGRERSVEVPT